MRGSHVAILAATILLAPGARAAGECAGAYHEAGRAVAVGPERLGSQGMMVGIWSSKPMTADGSSCFPDVGDGEPAQLDRSSCAALLMLEGCGDAMAEAYSRYPTLNQHWVWPSRTTHPFWSNVRKMFCILGFQCNPWAAPLLLRAGPLPTPPFPPTRHPRHPR